MPAPASYDYAVIRVVPRVEREEFINVGVILFCRSKRYLEAQIELDEARLTAFAPDLDLELIKLHLASIPQICKGGPSAGPIGALSLAERFHWLIAPRSTLIQVSPAHVGLCQEPGATIEQLLNRFVRRPAPK